MTKVGLDKAVTSVSLVSAFTRMTITVARTDWGAVNHARVKKMHRFWKEVRGDLPAPTRKMIDPLKIGWALGHLSLIDVMDNGDLRFRLTASDVTFKVGYEFKGLELSRVPVPAVGDILRRCLVPTAEAVEPMAHSISVTLSAAGSQHAQTHFLIAAFPLMSAGDTVDGFAVITDLPRNFREIADGIAEAMNAISVDE